MATVEVSVDELTLVSPATDATVAPRVRAVEPRVTDELDSLALVIEPASIVVVTVLESPVVIRVPVVSGRVKVLDAVNVVGVTIAS